MSLFHRRFTPQGASPGSFSIEEQADPPRVSVLAYDANEVRESEGDSASKLHEQMMDSMVTWIDVRGLGDGSAVMELAEPLGLHRLAVSDVINVGQRPKVEKYDTFLFVVMRMVVLGSEGQLHWEQVSLFVGERYVLTFQETHADCLDELRNRIRSGRKIIRSSGADYLACMVIDAIVDGYFPVLEHYGELLEDFEKEILEEKSSDVLGRLYVTKRELAGFRRATWPLRDALNLLMRDEDVPLTDMARLHLRDTADHTMQVVEVTESYRELSASLVDVHLSMVGQRTNDIMRVLTVVSAIFVPLTFVAGIYGMNFDTELPMNLPELGWRHGYLFFWIVCLALATTLLIIFRRLGWLGGQKSWAK